MKRRKVPALKPLTQEEEELFDRELKQPPSRLIKHPPTRTSPAARREYPQDRIGPVKGNA